MGARQEATRPVTDACLPKTRTLPCEEADLPPFPPLPIPEKSVAIPPGPSPTYTQECPPGYVTVESTGPVQPEWLVMDVSRPGVWVDARNVTVLHEGKGTPIVGMAANKLEGLIFCEKKVQEEAPAAAPDPFVKGLNMMLTANSDAAVKKFTAARQKKAQNLYNGMIETLNKFDPEPDMALYVVTLVYHQVTRDACKRAGI